ncbi:hypothetical protein JCM3765_006589 [Sporobolomyces pararoseus]
MSLAAMSTPPPPHTLSIPPAPRIGTAGSPLDPPSITSRQPREGLGLGGIEMPEGMKGTAEDNKDRKFDTRYVAFKPQRSGHLRHAASVSSPPSLIPFVKSLHSTPSNPPAPSVTSRKFSLQPQSSSHSGHSRKASEGLISYPIVSRIDSLPTFTPDEERRPAPIPTTTINDYRASGVPIPASSTRTVVDEDRTPTPKQRRPSRTTRSPPPSLDLDFSGVSNYSVFPVRPSATSSRARRGSNATTSTEKTEKVSSSSNRLRGLRISHGSSRASSQFDSSDEEDSPMIGSSGSRRGSHAVSKTSYPGHRRTASEESPRIVQAVTFNRAKSAEDVVPSDLPVKHLLGGGGSAGVPPTRTWNTASPALIPISEVKAAKAKAQALESPTKKTATQSTSTRLSTTRQASESISISVKDSAQTKEFGKAAVGKEGVTVCLRSYAKPEDMEVSWSCVSRTDEEGRPFTQWEMKLKPRSTNSSSSSGLPPSQALPPLPAPSVAPSNSNFLNYRINATSPSPSSANYPPQISRTFSTTSPLSQTIDPLAACSSSHSISPVETRRRKSSSTSTTSRSDSFSNGTSFSSESSFGPPTPASSVSGSSHRRRKSSISHALSSHDFSEEKEVPPPLPTASYFDIPLPPTTTTSIRTIQREDRSISPSRSNRSSSYNVGKTSRQFSIDQSVNVPRSASVPEAGIRHASNISSSSSSTSSQKSPTKDNRFARCLPPTGESKLDLTNLTSSSTSQSNVSSFPSGGSFLASRQSSSSRKQSIAPPPPTLSIPPAQSLVEDSTHRLTSPFTPSPLGRSSNNTLSSNSSISSTMEVGGGQDQNRTPTRSSHFKHSINPTATTTTPSPPPPPTASLTSYYTTNKDYYGESRGGGEGGGTSEELVSSHYSRSISPSPSPCFSRSRSTVDDDEEEEFDEEEEKEEERMIKMRQGKRMMSCWSDTETEEEDGESSTRGGGEGDHQSGLTSWGKLPDSNLTTDDEE